MALGHIPVDEELPYPPHPFKKKGLWSGIKQIFNNKPRNRGTGPRRQFSSEQQSLSYSCLGNPRAEEEEEEYRRIQNARRLSRNLSLSHESVFQMDPHPTQVVTFLQSRIY